MVLLPFQFSSTPFSSQSPLVLHVICYAPQISETIWSLTLSACLISLILSYLLLGIHCSLLSDWKDLMPFSALFPIALVWWILTLPWCSSRRPIPGDTCSNQFPCFPNTQLSVNQTQNGGRTSLWFCNLLVLVLLNIQFLVGLLIHLPHWELVQGRSYALSHLFIFSS